MFLINEKNQDGFALASSHIVGFDETEKCTPPWEFLEDGELDAAFVEDPLFACHMSFLSALSHSGKNAIPILTRPHIDEVKLNLSIRKFSGNMNYRSFLTDTALWRLLALAHYSPFKSELARFESRKRCNQYGRPRGWLSPEFLYPSGQEPSKQRDESYACFRPVRYRR